MKYKQLPIDFICLFEEKKTKEEKPKPNRQTNKQTQNLISFSSALDGACYMSSVVSSVPSK